MSALHIYTDLKPNVFLQNLTQETDEPAVPLDLRHGSFSELSTADDSTVLQNGAAVEQNSRYRNEELRIAVDVNSETVKISANDIAQF